MTLKEMIEKAIEMGMRTFTVRHFQYKGKTYKQSIDTIFDFIKGYENAIPMMCFFGTYHGNEEGYLYPDLCHITYRLENEEIPTFYID